VNGTTHGRTQVRSAGAALLTIAAGAVLLAWPAFLNGYPLLFSDTGAFLAQTLVPLMIWDKPWIYGPLLHVFHWRMSLWLPLAAQTLMVSHLLWLVLRVVRGQAGLAWHLAVCAGVAALTTAPFTIALLMPDVFAPVVVLAMVLLGFGRASLSRGETLWLMLLATLGIAAHLSHLPLAWALLVVGGLLARRWRPVLRMAAPLAGAVLLLLVTNAVGHGRISLSPHGATFLLARLQEDGPATRTLQAECPARGWYLCGFVDRLPMDSDTFLWAPDSPVNRDAAGQPRFLGGALLSDEAGAIVAETLRREPFAVAMAMTRNAAAQLLMAGAGDTLANDHLPAAVGGRIDEYFSAAEAARFAGSLQMRGLLPAAVASALWVHVPVLILGAVLCLAALWRNPRAETRALVLLVLVGVAANALATGGLSKPHHRYEARILWLVPFAGALVLASARRRA
jgi:hypothetical protein